MDSIPPPLADSAPDHAAPDHAVMIANAALAQASSRTALLARLLRKKHHRRFDTALVALVGLFAAEDRAVVADALDGSFHPRIARRSHGVR